MKYCGVFILILGISLQAYAKDFGSQAHYFSIQEESIQQHLQKQMQNKLPDPKSIAEKAKLPKEVVGITEATEPRTFTYTPQHIAAEDIKDLKGNIIVKKGATYNPLNHCKPSSNLLFIDGSNKKHIDWAAAQGNRDKVILVKGSPLDLEAELKRPIYFDQMGCYTNTFSIKHVPARVSVQDTHLLVEELPIKEEKPLTEVNS